VPLDECADEMLAGKLGELLDELRYERCQACASLIATDERRDPELLEQIYRTLPESYWSHLNPQTDFSGTIARYLAERCDRGDLWDVGCGSGNLLANLDNRWEKHGIEPGARAVELARKLGLDVHAGTASRLGLRDVADAVLMIDVVEHLADPVQELEAVADMLRPGGTLALFTGEADAWLPRLARGRWYYLHCIGHITIFSRMALRRLLASTGFTDVKALRVEHPGGVGLPRWIRRAVGNGLRAVLGRPLAAQLYHRDHQLVLASKPTARAARGKPN
jgi:SAM-dependent methyltransferase